MAGILFVFGCDDRKEKLGGRRQRASKTDLLDGIARIGPYLYSELKVTARKLVTFIVGGEY